jgi:predicted transcriptional regulator
MSKSIVEALGGNYRVNDIVQALGSTRAAAQEIGVSQRAVERYLVFESGKGGKGGKQARDPMKSKATRNKVNAAGRKLFKKETTVSIDGTLGINGRGKNYERERHIDLSITDDEYGKLQELAQAGAEAAAWAMLADIYDVNSMYLADGDIDFL